MTDRSGIDSTPRHLLPYFCARWYATASDRGPEGDASRVPSLGYLDGHVATGPRPRYATQRIEEVQ